jgi:hypothetical protein
VIAIPDPDVVFTDLGLGALGAYLGWRLWRERAPGVVVMLGLASAALWGALFHAFFPAKTATTAGYVVWLFVAFSIAVVAESLLDMALTVLFARLSRGVRHAIVFGYCVLFAVVILFVDESFTTITRLYAPTVLLMLGVAQYQASRSGNARWMLVSGGLALSVLAALLQQARISIHPVYFDHNALYHVVQAAALVLLYFGFRAVRLRAG